jgi:serine/threonine protein kinase
VGNGTSPANPHQDEVPPELPFVTPMRSAPPAPSVGAWPKVPGYEILKKIGEGGMGVVYQARQVGLNRVVALKMIKSGAGASAEQLHRFRIEAEAVARLQHPNIVQIHEIGEHDGLPYFSLEFCAGGSLGKLLAGTPQPPQPSAALVETLARAVYATHERNILHRDLKPANVLLAPASGGGGLSFGAAEPPAEPGAEWTPKITDFGLAKKLGEEGHTVEGRVMGTPGYMAPEQALGKTSLGPACDVYALGAILYECLTGRPPWWGSTSRRCSTRSCTRNRCRRAN